MFYIGQSVPVLNDDGTMRRTFEVDDDMANYVQVYLDSIADKMMDTSVLLVEQRVDTGLRSMLYGPIAGTADAIVLEFTAQEIITNDLKYGRGVRVDAPDNPQLRLYSLGAIRAVRELGFDVIGWKVRSVIHQPRLDHYSDEVITVAELEAWAERVKTIVAMIDAGDSTLTPHDSACKFCPAKATCPALAKLTLDSVMSEFKDVADLTDWGLGKALDKLELIEQWCDAIRKAARVELDAGRPIAGWKLVEGRAGNRVWSNPEAAEELMKEKFRMTVDEMYEKKLISPTKAEKVMKDVPKRWGQLCALISRAAASLQIVKDTDPRPAAASIVNEFKATGE